MKEHSIYHRQWLSLWLILLLTVISNMLVLTFWLADTVSLKWSIKIGHSFRVLPEQPFRFIRCQTAVVLMGT